MSKYSFSSAPVLKRSRHIFDNSYTHFTDLNVGDLKPVYIQEVYPGDQFNIKEKGVIRSAFPFKRPIMDNLFVDTAFFFVPFRLIYDKWEQVITGGTAEPDDWTAPQDVDVPTIGSVVSVPVNSVLDILGVPSGTTANGVSVLPARAFAKVWNDWFRDENTMQSCKIQKGAYTSSEAPNNNAWAPNNYTGKLPKVSKIHDYFTSALRSTQKGSPVEIPVSGSLSCIAP